MPQITLEFSNNSDHDDHFDTLFQSIHQVLHETAGISLGNCKSRAIGLDTFYIADGDSKHAFAHLSVRFVEGKSSETRTAVGQQCLALLKDFFSQAIERQEIQLTVEVQDIQLAHYHKHPEGTLSQHQ